MKTDNSRERPLNTLALLASPLPHPDSAQSRTTGLVLRAWFSCQSHCLSPLESILTLGAWQSLPPILNKVRY